MTIIVTPFIMYLIQFILKDNIHKDILNQFILKKQELNKSLRELLRKLSSRESKFQSKSSSMLRLKRESKFQSRSSSMLKLKRS